MQSNVTADGGCSLLGWVRHTTGSVIVHEACVSDIDGMPGWQLHRLNGEFDGFWSMRINGNWRLVFRFKDGFVCEVVLAQHRLRRRLGALQRWGPGRQQQEHLLSAALCPGMNHLII
jgi:Txe/YoeB family toxin of Txe-Axe toxin-antitoxin module